MCWWNIYPERNSGKYVNTHCRSTGLSVLTTHCIQSWALLFCQSQFYVKIDSFWARDLISCVNGCFWPKWRWVNSFFDFCPFRHTFLTFFENPKKPKMSFFELETWFFGGREVFDQYEHGSTHFFISALLRSKMALYS